MQIFTREQALNLAERVLAAAEPAAFAKAFNTRQLAILGLAQRILEESSKTLALITSLEEKAAPKDEPAVEAEQRPAAPPAKKAARGRRRGNKATAEQLQELQGRVRRLLKNHESASRKEICQAAAISGVSLYNRLMASMKGELRAKGQRSKRTYSLK